jgi:hypothetical protein
MVGQKYLSAAKGVVTVPAGRIARRYDFGSGVSNLKSKAANGLGFKNAAIRYDKERIDKAKEDAKNLRRRVDEAGNPESDDSYKKRQNEIINRAQVIAWKRQGVEDKHYEIDPTTNKISLNDIGNKKVAELRTEASTKYTQGRRKAAQARIETVFGPKEKKKGTLLEAEAKLEELKKKKAKIDDETVSVRYHAVLKSFKEDVKNAEDALDNAIATGRPNITVERRNLAIAQKALAAHTKDYRDLESNIDKQERAVEDLKKKEEDSKKK